MKVTECGFVYMITCIITGKIYVGSTLDFDSRLIYYKKLNCKRQVKLYNSLVKYRIENHIFEIVWAGALEDMYKYETLIGWGFNVLERETGLNCKLPKFGDIWSCLSSETLNKIVNGLKGNSYRKGMKNSDNQKNAVSIYNKNRVISQKTKDKLKASKRLISINNVPVSQYDKNDTLIKEWDSIMDAIDFGFNSSAIVACCKYKIKTHKKFKWKYKE